jgi:hypothetical protein
MLEARSGGAQPAAAKAPGATTTEGKRGI